VAKEIDNVISSSDVQSNTRGFNEPYNFFGSHEVQKRAKGGWETEGTIRISVIEGEKTKKGQALILIVLIDEYIAFTGARPYIFSR
jgi:hypothetical protein